MENGKIKMWRDYFDMATFTNAVQPTRMHLENPGGDCTLSRFAIYH